MDSAEYKIYHENTMKNNNGTSAVAVFATILPQFFTIFHTIQLCAVLNLVYVPFRFLIEFILIIGSVVLSVTILNDFLVQILFSLFVITVTTAIRRIWGKWHVEPFIKIPAKRPEYIGIIRGITGYITAVAILAVDFQCFPRNLAKTETFGFGLMDVGVGLYVLSNGMISPDVKKTERMSWKKLKKELIGCSPLLVLGISRFFITKEIDYQQHVSEYGVHWNFFITLACVKLIGSIVMSFIRNPKNSKYGAIIILCLHEMFLELGLSKYVLNDVVERDNIFSANREGIISIPGYVGLYLASVYMGTLMQSDEEYIRPKELAKKAVKMGCLAIFSWKMIYVCDEMFGVSRRTANMGYAFWMISIDSTLLAAFMLNEILVYYLRFAEEKTSPADSSYLPIIINAINYNGLVFFLVANLLTGLVNILFQTMLLDLYISLTLITYYMFILCAIVVFLFINNIKLKIW